VHARLLRYLDVVSRVGSIRRASRELNVASSAINRQIIALEGEMGVQIFERLPRGLRLTAAGEILIEHVRETLKAFSRTAARMEALNGLIGGRITLATTPGLADGVIPSILSDFVLERPSIHVCLRTMPVNQIPQAVLSADADLGLGYYLLPNPGLRALLSFDTHFGMVASVDHPLALQTAVRLTDLIAYPLVLPETGMRLRTIIDDAFSRLAITAKPIIETNSIQTLKRLVTESGRVTLLNRLDVADECASGRLTFRKVIAPRLDPQPLSLVSRRVSEPLSLLLVESLAAQLPQFAD
jgi:DNA-binding transcriptional LysR family regulator